MNKKMKSQLVRLLNIHGISGKESNVRKYIKKELAPLVDKMFIDIYGNLLAVKKFGETDGKPVIMLNAHMDTVSTVKSNKTVREQSGVFTAHCKGKRTVLGADDRAGIAIVLSIIENIPNNFEGTVKISFTREEEIGVIGASNMVEDFYRDVDLSLTFDRRGNNDIVVGTMGFPFCSNSVGYTLENISKLNGFDYKCVEGGVSDAYEFSSKNVNSVNLSVGYEGEHTDGEFLVYKDMCIARDLGLSILKDISLYDYENFGDVPLENNWVTNYTSNSNYYYDKYHSYEDSYPEVDSDSSKIYIYNNFSELEINKEHLDGLINQLQMLKNKV